jgi:tight adherence protein C
MKLTTLEILWYATLAAIALAAFLAVYAVAGAPTKEASRLGVRGLKRRRALEGNGLWGKVEPLVRWLGVRLSGLVGDGARRRLDAQIDLAGGYLGITAEEYIAVSLVCAGAGLVFGAIIGAAYDNQGIIMIATTVVGGVLPYVQISGEADRRLRAINDSLPYVIDLMALGMSAGLDFPGSIRQVVDKASDADDPLMIELQRILRELQLGKTRKQALADFAVRAPTGPVTEFVSALIQAEERGNPVADVLQIQAGVARLRRSAKAEQAAAKAAIKMLGPLFLLFACIMMLVMGPMLLSISLD